MQKEDFKRRFWNIIEKLGFPTFIIICVLSFIEAEGKWAIGFLFGGLVGFFIGFERALDSGENKEFFKKIEISRQLEISRQQSIEKEAAQYHLKLQAIYNMDVLELIDCIQELFDSIGLDVPMKSWGSVTKMIEGRHPEVAKLLGEAIKMFKKVGCRENP